MAHERFVFHPARAVGEEGRNTASYVRLKDANFAAENWALFEFDQRDLVERRAWVGVALTTPDGLAVCGAHVCVDAARIAWLQGMVTDRAVRRAGIGRATVSFILSRVRDDLRIFNTRLTVRVMPDGQVNRPALALFGNIGFRPVHETRIAISGLRCDAHLRATAEEGGRYIRALVMEIDLASTRRRSG